ncbi:MAG TPA: N-6 DNA methylase [Patescibacteria group bacterium]|nr:N-6 DNA methylase [Patescibacteria group bacterium]
MVDFSFAESRSRAYTLSELKQLGWDVRHPSNGGHILEEQEAKHFDPRFDELLGKNRPDFLIYDDAPVMVIENKNSKEKINEALREAKEYAEELSRKYFDVRIATGVAGDAEEGVIVRNVFRTDHGWVDITGNGYPLTQLLNSEQTEQILLNKQPYTDLKIPTEEEFYEIAETINQVLHDADVNKSDRAAYLGAIVLALKEGDIDLRPDVIIKQINANVEAALEESDKRELIPIFKIKGSSEKLKTKLPLVFHNLDRLNIRALMNSGADILGKFFETFLRYGNDVKELGIVFTPRHITHFMCLLADVNPTDTVYDPACGTGGFLVSAFNLMKGEMSSNQKVMEQIKLHQLIGTDAEESGKIPALAVINMIFRGDGKSNIFNENCFSFIPEKFGEKFATKVLMNPPYAKSDEPEPKFIEHGLNSLKIGGLLCAIIPHSLLNEKDSAKWRKNLLSQHTVLAVISTPTDLFYPTAINTDIILIKAHVPHRGKIFYAHIDNDGYMIYRKKRINRPGEQLPKILELFKTRDTSYYKSEPTYHCYKELDNDDDICELVPEYYLDSLPSHKEELTNLVEQQMREFCSFVIKHEKELKGKSILEDHSTSHKTNAYLVRELCSAPIKYGIKELVDKRGLKEGSTPIISSKDSDNGCYGFFDYAAAFKAPILTSPFTGSIGAAFVQEFDCSPTADCLTFIPKGDLCVCELYYLVVTIRKERWRFNYGRKMTPARIGRIRVDFAKMDYENIENFRKKIHKTLSTFIHF